MTETNHTAAPTGFPPGRYGRRRQPRRGPRWVRVAMLAALVVAMVAVGTISAREFADRYGAGRPYHPTVERFYDITDRQVVVEFTVRVPAGETAVCAVRARAGHGREVGREEVLVVPRPGVSHPRVVHRLATSERPVTGEVQRCWPETAG